jgi:acetoacetyl-CoA reductase
VPGVSPEETAAASLAGKTAIVTGGGRGIGRATAHALAAEGVSLVVGYRSRDDAAEATRADLEARGAEVELVRADVAAEGSADALVAAALDRFGRLDLLVNNAGVNRDATLKRLSRRDYEEIMDVNFVGAVLLAEAASRPMIEAGFGRIANVSSFVAQKGNFGQANYAASKAALIGWTKTAALEWARHGITVNVVCPGFVETDMLATVPAPVREKLLAQIPLGRFARPDEVAQAIVFVLGAGYMTGAELNLNGGIHM